MLIKKSDKDKKYVVDFAGSIIIEARNKEEAYYKTYLQFTGLHAFEVQTVTFYKEK